MALKIDALLSVKWWPCALLFCLLIAPLAFGNNSAVKPVLLMGNNNNINRICLYEGETYSLGAVIVVSGIFLDCVPEKNIETEGRLMWKQIQNHSGESND